LGISDIAAEVRREIRHRSRTAQIRQWGEFVGLKKEETGDNRIQQELIATISWNRMGRNRGEKGKTRERRRGNIHESPQTREKNSTKGKF